MPLIFQDQIVSDDLHAHPDRLFLFGDNELRRGRGGQADSLSWTYKCRRRRDKAQRRTVNDSAYWTDADYDRITAIIDHDLAPAFDHIRLGGTVACPSAGLGTGRAELPSRAPEFFAYLRQSIIRLKRLGDTVTSTRRIPRVLNKRDIRGPLPPNTRYCGRPSPLETRSSSDETEPATKCATNTKRGCRHNRN